MTRDQAAKFVEQARKQGVYVRIDAGHPGTRWDMMHINVGPAKGKYHIPILAD